MIDDCPSLLGQRVRFYSPSDQIDCLRGANQALEGRHLEEVFFDFLQCLVAMYGLPDRFLHFRG